MLPAKTETTNPFILALQSKKILDYDKKNDALKEFSDLISKTYFEAGQKSEADNLKQLCHSLHDEVKKYFPFLRIDELKIAFANGVRKEYGEFFGLNIATFHSWVKAWQYSEKRKLAQLAIKNANEVAYAPVMDEAEAEYAWRMTIQKQFTKFKETGHLEIFSPTTLFKIYEERGFINLTDAEKKIIYDEAKNNEVEKAKIKRLNCDRGKRNELNNFLEREKNGTLNRDEINKIKAEARRIAIVNFYSIIDELEI